MPQRRSATRARLADPAPQVVELGPPHVAAASDLELLDLRRVDGKGPLDADAEGLLANRERLPAPAALALDHDALEDLGPAAGALDHLEVDADAVAGREPRHPPQLALLDALDDRAHGLRRPRSDAAAVRPETTSERLHTRASGAAAANGSGEPSAPADHPPAALLEPPLPHPLVVAREQHLGHPQPR